MEEKDCEINNYKTVYSILSYMKEKEENIIKETENNHITNDKISSLEKDLIASNAELEKQSKLSVQYFIIYERKRRKYNKRNRK